MPEHDGAFISRCLQSDVDAFSPLVDRYRKRVYTLALRMVQDAHAAEDIAQETFVRAYQKLNRFRRESSLEPWLMAICANLCRTHLKRRPRETDFDDLSEDDGGLTNETSTLGVDPEESLTQELRRVQIRRAVDSLPEKLRAVVVLRFFAGMSHRDIGKALDLSAPAVDHRLRDALRFLKQRLQDAADW